MGTIRKKMGIAPIFFKDLMDGKLINRIANKNPYISLLDQLQ